MGARNYFSLIGDVKFDFIECTYSGSNLVTVQYRSGGSGGDIVCTLELTYSGANVATVTKSIPAP